MSCQSTLSAVPLQKLTADVEAKKADLLTLKPLSDVISAAISLHDRQLVDDHVRYIKQVLMKFLCQASVEKTNVHCMKNNLLFNS